MGSRKNHHYIPRFYLKRFSINSEGKSIGLFNHHNSLFIPQADLRKQAYKAYLYGRDDKVEAALGGLESSVSRLFQMWTEERLLIPPPQDSGAFKLIKQFILYQLFRTPKSGNDFMQQLNDGFNDIVSKFYPSLHEMIQNGSVVHPDPVLVTLTHAASKLELLDCLDFKFIVNLSDLTFITSDAPVILYNQLMEQNEMLVGATGLTVKGLQIFFPIHPRLMICLYDPIIYSLDGRNACSTEDIEDVHQLNILQFIGSQDQVFFDDTINEKYIRYLSDEWGQLRLVPNNVTFSEEVADKRYQYLFSTYCKPVGLQLSFVKDIAKIESGLLQMSHPRHMKFERE